MSAASTGNNSNGVVRSGSFGGEYDFACKVMLIGDSGVGKTCLLVRFKDGAFLSGSFISTVGIDFRGLGNAMRINTGSMEDQQQYDIAAEYGLPANKVVDIDGAKVKLQIWDTAGQERFRSVTHAYYRDAHALLLLFDVTNRQSFENIRAWVGEIHEYANDDVVVMLLGNKADMTSERAVKREEAEKLGRDNSIPYMETSAKTGLNVDLAFVAVAKDLKMKKTRRPNDPKFNVREFVEQQKQTPSGCCS